MYDSNTASCIVGTILPLVLVALVLFFIRWISTSMDRAWAAKERDYQRLQKAREPEEDKELRSEPLQAEQIATNPEEQAAFFKKMLEIDTAAIARETGASVEAVEKELGYPCLWKALLAIDPSDLAELLGFLDMFTRQACCGYWDAEERLPRLYPKIVDHWEGLLCEASRNASWETLRKLPWKNGHCFEWFKKLCVSEAKKATDMYALLELERRHFCDSGYAQSTITDLGGSLAREACGDFEKLVRALRRVPSCPRENVCTCGASRAVYRLMKPVVLEKVSKASKPEDLEFYIPWVNTDERYCHGAELARDMKITIQKKKEEFLSAAIQKAAETQQG